MSEMKAKQNKIEVGTWDGYNIYVACVIIKKVGSLGGVVFKG